MPDKGPVDIPTCAECGDELAPLCLKHPNSCVFMIRDWAAEPEEARQVLMAAQQVLAERIADRFFLSPTGEPADSFVMMRAFNRPVGTQGDQAAFVAKVIEAIRNEEKQDAQS